MIRSLHIEGLAVVESAEIDFGQGLNVLTGETGAGKSLILSALSLLAGARAPKDVVRDRHRRAVVEAVFDTRQLPDLERELAELGFENEDHELIVRREIAKEGRSRARISGALVPVTQLAELLGGRLEISSQHDSQALLRPEFHGMLLDAAAGLLDQRRGVNEAYDALRALDEEASQLEADRAERARQQDYLRFQLEEIDASELSEGEFERVAAKRTRLVHAEQLARELGAAVAFLDGDPSDPAASGAADRLGEAESRVDTVSEWDPRLDALVRRLAEARAELSDLAGSLRDLAADSESDPAALASVEERWRTLDDLRRKYGQDEAAILAQRDAIARELDGAARSEARSEEIGERLAEAKGALRERAAKLSRARKRAARKLAKSVSEALSDLALPGAVFDVSLEVARAPEGFPCGATGAETALFRFAGNGEAEPRPLHRVASGGELSRLLLALKGATRAAGPSMLIVFDEVDAGIGGRAADRVGDLLADLAQEHQVLCITHLPQIAARGSRHLRIEKEQAGGSSRTQVKELAKKERIEEIARMAGGDSVTRTTRRHAQELLERSAPPPAQ